MDRLQITALIALLSMGPLSDATAVDLPRGCFGDRYRISALMDTPNGVRVGLIDTQTRESHLVSPGQAAGDLLVMAADYTREEVTVRLGNQVCVLSLRGAGRNEAARITPAPSADAAYRGAAIEEFLRKNPGLLDRSRIKFAASATTNGLHAGESLEEYLKRNPELARKIGQPAEGYGEGIGAYLQAHPEIKIFEGPIPDGSLGPGIEAALRAAGTNGPSAKGSTDPRPAHADDAQAGR